MPRPSGTWPTPRRTISSVALPAIGSPSKLIAPSVRTMPQMARSVVVLPAPLAPSSVVMPPGSSAKLDAVQRLRLAVVRLETLDLEQRAIAQASVPR